MAIIHPPGWRELKPTGAAAREIETLETLSDQLPDSYSIFHGVHWTGANPHPPWHGQISFVVLNGQGHVLLIEQLSGLLEESPEGLRKPARGPGGILPVRLAQQREILDKRLSRHLDKPPGRVDSLLYCPDYRVVDPGSAGIPATRIVDSSQREYLATIIQSLLPAGEADPVAESVARFLADEFRLVPDVSALIHQRHVLYTRLTAGLAHWARQIDCQPFRLRVTGTAGSGKTQLALSVLEEASALGRQCLYVCYNRPLADRISLLAPAGSQVVTWHQLADRLLRGRGQIPDFTRPGTFQRLEQDMEALVPRDAELVDELIVDEGQDFKASWLPPLLRLLRPGGRAWWLEDPWQNLYDRPAMPLPGWVSLKADTNYRSPQTILAQLNAILGTPEGIQSGSPIAGAEVEYLTYRDDAELLERTKTAITRGLGAGFKKDMIALITYRGRQHSRFTGMRRLGPHSLNHFNGSYDLLGNPVYEPGELLLESVYRFKGQAAPCVILTEVDFQELDLQARRKLFVGMTRATLRLILVLSVQARQCLESSLSPGDTIPRTAGAIMPP